MGDPQRVRAAWRELGRQLATRRKAAGFSQESLGAQTQYSRSSIGSIEVGLQHVDRSFWKKIDVLLGADGELIRDYDAAEALQRAHQRPEKDFIATTICSADAHADQAPDEDASNEIKMQRREILRALGALAASSQPLVQWEGLRQGVSASIDPDLDRWDQVVADYGIAYYRLPASEVRDTLRADLTVVQTLLMAATSGAARTRLLQVTACLSVIVGLSLVAVGQTLAAARWWRDAQRYADESGDADSIVLTRAWNVVNGCYDGRPPSETIAIADSVLPIVDGRATAASCGLLAGRAQALSLAGDHAAAIETVQRLKDVVEQLPTAVISDTGSLWGWPEHRLRHTEVWVYAHAGQLREATRAQERAAELYPATMSRLRTQVQLHHSAALIRGGHIPEGLRQAADLLDQLPESQHNQLLRTVALQVVQAVPTTERGRSQYRELTERLIA